MDEASNEKPAAAAEAAGDVTAGTTEPEGGGDQPGGSLLGRLFRRAAGGGHADDAADGSPRSELGPAFRDSTPAERTMVTNILRLRHQRVSDVMVPRADIVAVAVDAGLPDVIARFARGSLSRLPVYRETLDDPIGFVHLKDIALTHGVGAGSQAQRFGLADHIRQALFVPPSMRVTTLLQRMQAARTHMALVIDEFGGVDGLVTIEDLVEQIVGEIEDEHDTQEPDQWTEEAPGIYVVDARTDIREFEEAEELRLRPAGWEEEVETLGGLVFMLTGRVPARGEVIAHPAGHEFEIIDADPRRIKRMRLTLRGAGSGDDRSRHEAAE